ncbi:hypothetical protein PAXINDRAFT_22237 [Paxillus involutus ATCC 200175]|uniref:Uncharacterized protein n=1 Tax=Paxillus involutus ATCC 200175 TaxID=664439 RepID=A0A0C9SZD1_PAXIN|nr:hypothetical protein PAXINDRAFT_22237 [Paxillus involutus ATCC 200175]
MLIVNTLTEELNAATFMARNGGPRSDQNPADRSLPVITDDVLFWSEESTGTNENKLPQVLPPLQQPSPGVSNMVRIERVRTTIHRLLAGCNVQYKVVPFDHDF